MNKEITTNDASSGLRPLVKIGGQLYPPSSHSSSSAGTGTDSSGNDNKNPVLGDWNFEYRPGSKSLAMSVRVDQSSAISLPIRNHLTMEIDEKGVNDLIAWLYGVKNSISSSAANTPS